MKSAATGHGLYNSGHQSGQFNDSHEELIRQLSADERLALEALGYDPPRRSVPSQQAFRLLQLGLAELSCGRLVLTAAGITARAVLRDP